MPNAITAVRLVLAIALFVLQSFHLYLPALIMFILAAGTDWMDGYWARKYGQVTKLGRVFDPFVDKVLICGVFIFLGADYPNSGVHAGVAVIIFAREMLVTVLRSMIEQGGGDFSASRAGKWKMVFQCAAVVMSLIALCGYDLPDWYGTALTGVVWFAVGSTIYSGIGYINAAAKFFKDRP